MKSDLIVRFRRHCVVTRIIFADVGRFRFEDRNVVIRLSKLFDG
jgi:hypothetical protein